jgi:hypothetical protein
MNARENTSLHSRWLSQWRNFNVTHYIDLRLVNLYRNTLDTNRNFDVGFVQPYNLLVFRSVGAASNTNFVWDRVHLEICL